MNVSSSRAPVPDDIFLHAEFVCAASLRDVKMISSLSLGLLTWQITHPVSETLAQKNPDTIAKIRVERFSNVQVILGLSYAIQVSFHRF